MRALYNIKNFWYHIIKEEVSLLHRMIRGVTNMSEFKKIQPEQVSRNPFTLIGRDWALLTGGTPKKCNPMTVSWGGVGVLWNKPVATVYVRPQRYTLEMLYAEDQFTLCFFEEGTHRDTLGYCGKVSGRDTDKVKDCGLTVIDFDGAAGFQEADLVLVCNKKYVGELKEENFCDMAICKKDYPNQDYHKIFIAEITAVYQKEKKD